MSLLDEQKLPENAASLLETTWLAIRLISLDRPRQAPTAANFHCTKMGQLKSDHYIFFHLW